LLDEAAARCHALDLSSPAFAQVIERLANVKTTLVIGLIELEGGLLFNTAVVVSQGKLLGRYRKTNLLERERLFTAGSDYPVFAVGELKFGINICYDTNFPEAARAVAEQGADLIVCPANNMMRRDSAEKYKPLHNSIRSRRCIETGLWLMSSDVTGARGDSVSYGPTAIIRPDGEVLAQAELLQPGMIVGEIGFPNSGTDP
jgi:predicted amidohydrolase